MVVWVKEYLDILTIKSLKTWLKDNLEIKKFLNFKNINLFDVVIVSNKDIEIDDNMHNEYNIIIFEETFDIISKQIIDYVNSNFEYYFIKNSLNLAKTEKIDTIITGSSYGRFGVNENDMSKTINLSLSSQDLYYCLKGVKKVIQESNTIKNIVLCVGYYLFCIDLSKIKNLVILNNIPNVYMPIFGDDSYHNCFSFINNLCVGGEKLSNPIFNVNSIAEIYAYSEYIKGYYNDENRLRTINEQI